ncbi:MAG: glycosyltransferase family 2 protein [Lachnospiraceae bacterium]|nr:glycosyltransferase family 2 protein [Lachnospiraceae bacterium]
MGEKMYCILLATYNGEKYVQELLDSIEAQTVTDWELIAFDDRSTDKTYEILREFQKKHRKQVIVERNVTSTGNAKDNFALLFRRAKKSNAQYFLPADQDDVWLPDKIEKLSNAMNKMEERFGERTPVLIHSDLIVADSKLNVISESFFEYAKLEKKTPIYKLVSQNNVTGCACMINRELLMSVADEIGLETVMMHDYWCALYAAVFGRIAFLNTPTVYYRQHGNNSLGAQKANSLVRLYKRFSNGRRDYIRDVKATRMQAKTFAECYESRVNEVYKYPGTAHERSYKYMRVSMELLSKFGDLDRKTKVQKLKFYYEYKVWKKGAARVLAQILWS